ncbi:hypothetical protein [Croceivirga thetidis]|uniref:Lipocalin-like domain-containing protein n=1 Tax=Croceivirga thetidis TaxID=2721623 RepID=A0ABX1GTY3_9FLAO|nr:hypothetical protein [Croceivirga thetidis]NKI33108.1 hypothetical protein [Croceivirga thetidis]
MKKLFSLLAIMAILVVSNCSKIPENNDPILGTWENETTLSPSGKLNVDIKEEWIFNDVYLGRYHKFENGQLTIISDFRWKKDDEQYTISYPGLDRADEEVNMDYENESEVLERMDGKIFARRR